MVRQYRTTDEFGTFYYFKDTEMTILHRTDGPAVEWVDGGREWWSNGKRHRLDGPAIEYANGPGAWFVNNKFIFDVGMKGNIQARMR